jgi:hypothetical protein
LNWTVWSLCWKKSDKTKGDTDFDASCLLVSRASNLCEDLDDEEDLDGDELEKNTPIIIKNKKRRKKSYDKKLYVKRFVSQKGLCLVLFTSAGTIRGNFGRNKHCYFKSE